MSFTEFSKYRNSRMIDPVAKHGKGNFSVRKFKMNKEMVERYEKLVVECTKAWENFVNCLPTEYPELAEIAAEQGKEFGCLYVLNGHLYLEDGTHILDAWERAKEYQRIYISNIRKIYESEDGSYGVRDGHGYYYVGRDGFKAFEYRKLKVYNSGDKFTKKATAALNLIAKEFNEFWLPLLEEQGDHIYCMGNDTMEYILSHGIVGSFASAMEEVYGIMSHIVDNYCS